MSCSQGLVSCFLRVNTYYPAGILKRYVIQAPMVMLHIFMYLLLPNFILFTLNIHYTNVFITGWVVTWFLLEYTVRIFGLNVSRFLYVFSSIPRKLYTIFQPTLFPNIRYQDILCKLLTLSTNSVTNKMIVVRTVYLYNSGSISATKNFVTESVLKVRSFIRI